MVIRASFKDAHWLAPTRAQIDTSNWMEPQRQTQYQLERLYLTVGLELSGDPTGASEICGSGYICLD